MTAGTLGGVPPWDADDDALRDDRVWDRVWERMLDPVERHGIALAVWRRRLPDGMFEARIAVELARRWRRLARNLMILYGLWSLFWGAIALDDWRADAAFSSLLCPVCALVGTVAIAGCIVVRRRLLPFIRTSEPPPAG
jgi:hypothetical protein